MKQALCTVTGMIGAAAAWAFGGWDTAMVALVVCIAVDYLSGSIVARSIHFIGMFSIVLFFIVHMILLLLSGPFKKTWAMIAGGKREVRPE